MRTIIIIIHPPPIRNIPQSINMQRQFSVEQLIPQLAVSVNITGFKEPSDKQKEARVFDANLQTPDHPIM